jgi:hypothetical protein
MSPSAEHVGFDIILANSDASAGQVTPPQESDPSLSRHVCVVIAFNIVAENKIKDNKNKFFILSYRLKIVILLKQNQKKDE